MSGSVRQRLYLPVLAVVSESFLGLKQTNKQTNKENLYLSKIMHISTKMRSKLYSKALLGN